MAPKTYMVDGGNAYWIEENGALMGAAILENGAPDFENDYLIDEDHIEMLEIVNVFDALNMFNLARG